MVVAIIVEPQLYNRGVAMGEVLYRYIYPSHSQNQAKKIFLLSNNDVRAVVELIPQWVLKFYTFRKNFYISPKQISGYAPAMQLFIHTSYIRQNNLQRVRS